MRDDLLRRRLLLGAAAMAGIGGAPSPPLRMLKSVAAGAGVLFGSAVEASALLRDSGLAGLVRRQCAVVTPELSLKWAALETAPGVLDFSRMDALAQFARANGLRVRGHTLLWGRSVPDWARAQLAVHADWSLIQRFFASVIPRYGDLIDEWDVVNEPIETGLRMDDLRGGPFLQAFGPDYIRRALEEARVYAPHARLMINEYALESDLPLDGDRRYLFLKLVESLKRVGAPLDGVGLQSHLDLGRGRIDHQAFARFLHELAGFGLCITVTELDVKEVDYIAPVEIRDQEVAAIVADYLAVILDQQSVKSVLTWGLSDRTSWLRVTAQDRARFPGAWRDGSDPGFNRGLPFDAALEPKPMYKALLAAFAHRRRR